MVVSVVSLCVVSYCLSVVYCVVCVFVWRLFLVIVIVSVVCGIFSVV